jgi:outer membrane biogenesis lipoprotein LolB
MKGREHFAFCITCLISLAFVSCAPKRFTVPTDPGSPLSDYSQIHEQVSSTCRGVRTLTAELGLRGRAGSQRLRGRLHAGFERPDSMRLEAVAPFGSPVFILTSRGTTAVLLLTREDRVVRGESAEAILGALTGVSLSPADLQAILDGCVVPEPRATGGRRHADGSASIDLAGGATIYLRRAETWQVRAARRAGWQIEYPAWEGSFPGSVRLQSDSSLVDVDVTATLTQIETNAGIRPDAFSIDVPPSARPLSIAELRDAGPLGDK